MILDNVKEAGYFVFNHLRQKYKDIPNARWLNEGRNAFYTVVVDGYDKSFFLKYDRQPFYSISRELPEDVRFKGAGVCINQTIYDTYVEPSQADVLYALPGNIYHLTFADFEKARVPIIHKQRYNDEYVVVAPLASFKPWIEIEKDDKLDKYI